MLAVAYLSLIIQSDKVHMLPDFLWVIMLSNDKSWLRFQGAADGKFVLKYVVYED